MILFDIYIYSDCDHLLVISNSTKGLIEELKKDNMYPNNDYTICNYLDLRMPKFKKCFYSVIKERLRNNAIYYSNDFSSCNSSYYTLNKLSSYFETYGKKYGLLTEFKENGII